MAIQWAIISESYNNPALGGADEPTRVVNENCFEHSWLEAPRPTLDALRLWV